MTKLYSYIKLARLNKPIGIYLLLYPTFWALLLANYGRPSIDIVLIFTFGVIIMRSAGCIINDIADRNIDGFINRTKNRPLVNNEISVKEAIVFFICLLLVALVLVLLTNILTILLAILAVILASLYPFAKRYTNMPQLILAIAFAMSIAMVFSASVNSLPSELWWLFATSVVWTLIYDTIYAIGDREEDLKIAVKSSAILFGKYDKKIIALLQLLLLVLLVKIGLVFKLNFSYYLFLAPIIALMIYHQYLIKDNNKALCLKAFLDNHYIGLLVLVAIIFGQNNFSIFSSLI